MSFNVLKHGIKIRHIAVTFIFLCTLESFLFRFVLVSLEKSESSFKQSINLRTKENEEWYYFQHVGNEMFIGNPVIYQQIFHEPWDWGVMDIYGFGKDRDGEDIHFRPGLHAICDINGNSLNWNDVKSEMTVKIKAKKVAFEGYQYMYRTPNEWICYDKLRNRNDDSDSDNLKQEWVVEKYGDTIRFENKYYPGDNLMGNLKYKANEPWGPNCTCCVGCTEYEFFDVYWMYAEKDNPNWWKLIPANI